MYRKKFLVDLLSPIKEFEHTTGVLDEESGLSIEELDHIMKKAERIMLAATAAKEYRLIRSGK